MKYSDCNKDVRICDRGVDDLVGWREAYDRLQYKHSILDIGCGVGNVCEWLQGKGHEVIGAIVLIT